MSGVPKTTLRLNNSLEELTGLLKAIILIVMDYRERIHFTINKGKSCIGQNPGETREKLQESPPSETLWGCT